MQLRRLRDSGRYFLEKLPHCHLRTKLAPTFTWAERKKASAGRKNKLDFEFRDDYKAQEVYFKLNFKKLGPEIQKI